MIRETEGVTWVQDASDFGRAVREARKRRGDTQDEVAQFCRCSRKFVSDLERGVASATLNLAIKVAGMAGLDVVLKDKKVGTTWL